MAQEIPLIAILSFLTQVGFALTGAAGLWGLYFQYRHRQSDGEQAAIFLDVTQRMVGPISIGTLIALLGWIGIHIFTTLTAYMPRTITLDPGRLIGSLTGRTIHEGITIVHGISVAAKQHAVTTLDPAMAALTLFVLAGITYRHIDPDGFEARMGLFYSTILLLSTLLISVPVVRGQFDGQQLFFIGHSAHSILTVGTVLILDFILLVTKYSKRHEVHLYPVLPSLSKAVWIGLAIEFISVAFIFREAIALTPKVLFMQTVIGVIIINGVVLSGPITQKMISTIREGQVIELSRGWEIASVLSGSISIASWLTITFVDFIDIQVGYTTLMAAYLAFIAASYIGYEIMEHYKVGARLA